MALNYILSISAKGILPEVEPKGMNELEQRFGPLIEVHASPWRLSQEGFDEKIYSATRPITHPLTREEVEQFKAIFDMEKRILKIYKLVEEI